ncbi:MAG: DUF4157 domain-containing protein [Pseudomonadota bacterium]
MRRHRHQHPARSAAPAQQHTDADHHAGLDALGEPLSASSVLDLQRAGMSMSAIRELIAGRGEDTSSVFDGAAAGAARTLPHRDGMEDAFGLDLAGVDVHQGPEVDASLEVLGARAAERDGSVLLPSTGVTPDLVGHEVAHVAQGSLGGAGRHAPAAASAPTESEAHDLGARAARGEPVSVQQPRAEGVALWSLGDAWDSVQETASSGASWVGEQATGAWDGATDAWDTTWTTAQETASSGVSWLGEQATGAWDVASDAWDTTAAAASSGATWLGEQASDAWDFTQDAGSAAVDWTIGENGGEAWGDIWDGVTGAAPLVPGPTGGVLPQSLADEMWQVNGMVPSDAAENGMHAWHAGTNAMLAEKLGIVGAPLIFLGGLYHESPLDRESFKAEQDWQGTVNHLLDSTTDIVANTLGMGIGYLDPSDDAVQHAITVGNEIPGPGDPDPAFGGPGGGYGGHPSAAW